MNYISSKIKFMSIRKLLFYIGCSLIFYAFVMNVLFYLIINDDSSIKKMNWSYVAVNIAVNIVFFFIGTFLVSNNKPEK